MKQYFRPKFLPIFVPAAGVTGMLLRWWTMGAGPDAEGLYAPQPLAWTLLWTVTVLTLAAVAVLGMKLKNPGRYSDHFPASLPGAIGTGLAALAVGLSRQTLTPGGDLLSIITGILGVITCMLLIFSALNRYQGKKPPFFVHVVPCIFFALRIFLLCRVWSSETQTGVFVFPFLASICVMLASYQRACFDVNLGKRSASLFWSLSGVYFSLLALPGSDEPLFYFGMAAWLLTNLCSLRPLKPRKPLSEPEATAEPAPAEPQSPAAEPGLREDMSLDELKSWLDQE